MLKTRPLGSGAFFILPLFLLLGCSQNIKITNGQFDSIAGSVSGVSTSSLNKASNGIFSSCTSETVKLYSLTASGGENELLAEVAIDSEGKFSFTGLSNKGVLLSSSGQTTTKYLLRFTCGTEVLNRFVTGPIAQNIDFGTTIVSWLGQTQNGAVVANIQSEVWKKLYAELEAASSVENAYDRLVNNQGIKKQFRDSLDIDPEILSNAAPIVRSITVPQSFNEEAVNAMVALVHHWNPAYTIAYEWRLNGSLICSTTSCNYTPLANAQGDYTLQLFVGSDNGSGGIDTSKAYYQKVYDISVNNSVLPVPPSMTRLSAAITASTSQSVRLTTGAVVGSTFQNCRTFSHLAIVEDSSILPALPPLNPNLYTYDCTTGGTQDIAFVSDGTEGPRVLRAWAMDASGRISAVSSDVYFTYDITAPTLNISSPASNFEAQSGVTVAGTCETGLVVNIAGAGVNAATTPCTAGAFSSTVTFTVGDGSKVVTLSQVDGAGNSSSVSRTFVKDTVAPVVTIASPAALTVDQTGITLSGTCEIGLTIDFAGSGIVANSALCVSGSFAVALTFSGGDGTKVVSVSQMDAAGNSGSDTRNFTKDTTAPVLTFTSPAENFSAKTGVTIVGSCEPGLTVSVSGLGATSTTTTCAAGTFSTPITFSAIDGTKTVNVSQLDGAGNTGTASRNFEKDTTAPLATTLSINGGTLVTGNRNVLVSFTATSSRVDIDSFCIKSNDPSLPTVGDSCWQSLVSVGSSVTDNASIVNFPFQVGAILGPYDLRVWYKDSLGNISDNLSAVNSDFYTISYFPDTAASVSNLIAASTNTPSSPLISADTTVLLSADLYVFWTIADNNAIPAGNINIYYTANETTYTLLQSGLSNGINGACTLAGAATGCARLTAGSPLSSYYKLKVEVTDSGGSVSYSTTNPVNTAQFNLLSGNTSLGLGGSAASAILLGRYEKEYNDNPDPQVIAVTKTGHIFFNYLNKGLAYISPVTGFIEILTPVTGTSTGDGGSVSAATLTYIRKMTLDKDDNLLIWDANRIRKVSLASTPWQITTLAGGGGSTADGASATSASLHSIQRDALFAALPNGRIYYENNLQIWYYDPTNSTVNLAYTLGGTGIGSMAGAFANYNISFCPMKNTVIAYDKSTSAITKIIRQGSENTDAQCGSVSSGTYKNASFSLSTGISTAPHPPDTSWSSSKFVGNDGKIYILEQGRSRLLRYNTTNNTNEVVIAGTSPGRCVDGTLATSCPAVIMSAYVNEFGRVYFLDMGVIRMIDDTGRVQTLAGQPRNFGIGENPVSARYSQINFFSVDGDDVYVLNKLENQIVKFSLNGGNLSHIAGNSMQAAPSHGNVAVSAPLQNCGWSMPCGFVVDGAAQRLYHRVNDKYSFINLATGQWDVSSYQVQDSNNRLSYLGLGPSGPIAFVPSHYGTSGNKQTIREINTAGPTDTIVFGTTTISTTLPTDLCDGAVGSTCELRSAMDDSVQMQYKYDSANSRWLLGYKGRNYLNTLPLGGGTTARLEIMARAFDSFDYRYAPDLTVFYCGTDGKLYKRNTVTDVETTLTLPSSTITCTGQALHYHSGRDSLIFIFKQNDLYGIAEYKNP